MSKTYVYKSPNGYSGKLYGKSSMIIFDPDGREVFHTGFRAGDTYEYLAEMVDTFPEFQEILLRPIREGKT